MGDTTCVAMIASCEISHRKIMHSLPPVATSWLSGKKATVYTSSACWSTRPKGLRVAVLHSRAVASLGSLAISSPLGEIAKELMASECARNGDPSGTSRRTPEVDLATNTCGKKEMIIWKPDYQ
jgi:hypothetical protein